MLDGKLRSKMNIQLQMHKLLPPHLSSNAVSTGYDIRLAQPDEHIRKLMQCLQNGWKLRQLTNQ